MTDAARFDGNVLRGIRVAGREGVWDLSVGDGAIRGLVGSATAPSGWLALPALRELHVHADRAFSRASATGSLEKAIAVAEELHAAARADEVAARSERLLRRSLAHGAASVRTHITQCGTNDATVMAGALAARERLAGEIDVEVVAFATGGLDPSTRAGRNALLVALDHGADLLGGFVHHHPSPRKSLDGLLELAVDTGRSVDVHIDEHLSPGVSLLEDFADLVIERGLEGRAIASHCCALAAMGARQRRRVIDKLAAADVTVVVLPAINLYLQDRGTETPRRGLAPVEQLVAAGVPVRIGSDNVQDSFFPYGDGDPLESAYLAAIAGQVDDIDVLLAGICDGAVGLHEGDELPLLLIRASSTREAIAVRAAGRMLLAR